MAVTIRSSGTTTSGTLLGRLSTLPRKRVTEKRMPRLALYTFGVLKMPLADPGLPTQEFHQSVTAIYDRIDQCPGYVAHAAPVDLSKGAHFDCDWAGWGEFVAPAWYQSGRTAETTALAATLSLWTDLQSAYDFVYTGLHRAALNRRYDWFEKTGRPGLVFWWVADGTVPTWQDAVPKLEYLQDHEPAPQAFTFRHPFNQDGTPATLGTIGGPDSLAAH